MVRKLSRKDRVDYLLPDQLMMKVDVDEATGEIRGLHIKARRGVEPIEQMDSLLNKYGLDVYGGEVRDDGSFVADVQAFHRHVGIDDSVLGRVVYFPEDVDSGSDWVPRGIESFYLTTAPDSEFDIAGFIAREVTDLSGGPRRDLVNPPESVGEALEESAEIDTILKHDLDRLFIIDARERDDGDMLLAISRANDLPVYDSGIMEGMNRLGEEYIDYIVDMRRAILHDEDPIITESVTADNNRIFHKAYSKAFYDELVERAGIAGDVEGVAFLAKLDNNREIVLNSVEPSQSPTVYMYDHSANTELIREDRGGDLNNDIEVIESESDTYDLEP